MKRFLLAAVVALAVLASASATGPPALLRAARAVDGHVAVTMTVGEDFLPGSVAVSTSPRTTASGAFPGSAVRLRETIVATPGVGRVLRYETRKRLDRGTYFVEVSAIETGGVTDCYPRGNECLVHWSNVRRLVVR
jgi:hypothetical protein